MGFWRGFFLGITIGVVTNIILFFLKLMDLIQVNKFNSLIIKE